MVTLLLLAGVRMQSWVRLAPLMAHICHGEVLLQCTSHDPRPPTLDKGPGK